MRWWRSSSPRTTPAPDLPVFGRREAVGSVEIAARVVRVGPTDRAGYLSNRQVGCVQQPGHPLHSHLPQIRHWTHPNLGIAEQVSDASAEQQEPGEGEQVGVDDHCRPRPTDGKATLTTETSSTTMNCATHANASTTPSGASWVRATTCLTALLAAANG
jgi:hypothetical protein